MKKLLITLFTLLTCNCLSAQQAPGWLRYPALSPDGTAIAFVYKGDLYKVAATGGTAQRLTSGAAHEFMPVWSHNGRAIAYAGNQAGNFDTYLIGADGSGEKRLTFYSADEYPYDFSEDDQQVIFGAAHMTDALSRQFPSDAFPQLYSVSTSGGRVKLLLSTPAENAQLSRSGKYLLYHDKKNRENAWRKHQVSSAARNIWLYDRETGKYRQLTAFAGEDRDPVFSPDEKWAFYLSEESGSFNVHRLQLQDTARREQLTTFKKHPVRFLSIAANGTLCFGFNGDIYLKSLTGVPHKITINIPPFSPDKNNMVIPVKEDIKHSVISPSGKAMAFIFRGEVFTADMISGAITRITHTPGEEADLSFSPDGKKLLYASERSNGWQIYEADLQAQKETPLTVNTADNYQPLYSPDGSEVAYIENRTTLRIFNKVSKRTRTITGQLFSRRDHDQYFRWRPDGKWLLLQYNEAGAGNAEAGLIAADGRSALQNITQSGFNDEQPQWSADGQSIIWKSDREGLRSFSSSATRQQDVYRMPFSRLAGNSTKLTPAAAIIGNTLLSRDGRKLYYLVTAGKTCQLWITDVQTKTSSIPLTLKAAAPVLQWDSTQQHLYLLSGTQALQLDTAGKETHHTAIKGEMTIDVAAERSAMFSHVWRRTKAAFYTAGHHGADWDSYGRDYEKKLPGISNNYELAELLSELLGELNVSHSGATCSDTAANKTVTASLGVLYDMTYTGAGMKIKEIIRNGPLDNDSVQLNRGVLITAINGQQLTADKDIAQYLNGQAEKQLLLTITDNGQPRNIAVVPVSPEEENELLYKRWVKRNQEEVSTRSNGTLGYVHLYRMNDAAYRQAYSDIMGRYAHCKGIIVDTRFNRGGDLASDLAMFLSGSTTRLNATDQQVESMEPGFRWTKPSIVIANEANYSDGSCFVYDYQLLHMGKLLGMPVPGSCTFMTGETLQDNNMHWSVPSLGVKDKKGHYLENRQALPDIQVINEPGKTGSGRDQQLETAIDQLLKDIIHG